MIEQKRIADNKKRIYNKFVRLYEQYVFNQKWEYCCDLVAMMKKEFGSDYLRSETLRRREFFQGVTKVVTFQVWDG